MPAKGYEHAHLFHEMHRPFSAVVPQSPMKLLKAAVEQKVFADRRLHSYYRLDRLLDLHVYPTREGAIVFFQDLTEHDLQHQEAVRAQVLLQSSLDASSAQVVVLDDAGTIIKSNAVWRKFAVDEGLIAPGLNYLQSTGSRSHAARMHSGSARY
jgi:hypothetical protein